jgi:hypothetical protein
LTGGCGILWSFAAFFLIYDKPGQHPRVSVKEKQYLLSTQEQDSSKVN